MKETTKSFAIWVVLFVSFVVSLAAQQKPVGQSAGLRIVVIGGEGAVNIIQQRTAVAPVVEVRDANNLPVPGVAVTFSVGGQGATFGGGLQTLTVATNAVGQAAATGLTPTATGAVQINATAALQGKTITATITQTNFATAQAAAQAATTAGSGSSAGTTAGAGAGSGGGMSTGAVVGIVGGVGAAAAAGVVVAGAKGEEGSGGTSFTGPLAGQFSIMQTVTGPGQNSPACTYNHLLGGTITLTLEQLSGPATGRGETTVNSTDLAASAPGCGSGPGGGNLTNGFKCSLTGTTAGFECIERRTSTGGTSTSTYTFTFSGSLNGGVITGTVTYALTGQNTGSNQGGNFTSVYNGSTTFPVTLR
jgi:hypothetical protein